MVRRRALWAGVGLLRQPPGPLAVGFARRLTAQQVAHAGDAIQVLGSARCTHRSVLVQGTTPGVAWTVRGHPCVTTADAQQKVWPKHACSQHPCRSWARNTSRRTFTPHLTPADPTGQMLLLEAPSHKQDLPACRLLFVLLFKASPQAGQPRSTQRMWPQAAHVCTGKQQQQNSTCAHCKSVHTTLPSQSNLPAQG